MKHISLLTLLVTIPLSSLYAAASYKELKNDQLTALQRFMLEFPNHEQQTAFSAYQAMPHHTKMALLTADQPLSCHSSNGTDLLLIVFGQNAPIKKKRKFARHASQKT